MVISESSKFLKANPQAKTWQEYTRAHRHTTFLTPDGVQISDDPKVLKQNPAAKTWKEYTRALDPNYKPYWLAPDGAVISEDRHYRAKNPSAMSWKEYTQKLQRAKKTGGTTKVDQAVVNDAVKELKELMGRAPTPKEVE